jgi:hypothetical protein
LALRRDIPAFASAFGGGDEGASDDPSAGAPARPGGGHSVAGGAVVDGAVLGDSAFALRFFPDASIAGDSPDERLLIVNLGPRTVLSAVPEPLLAPPAGLRWRLELSTDDVRYGGVATPEPETDEGWVLPAESAMVLRPEGSDRWDGPADLGDLGDASRT